MLDTSKCLLTKYAIQRILYRIKPFFDSKIGVKYETRPLQTGGVETMLRELGRQLNLTKVHPHKFRRTLATSAIDKGMPIEQVQQLLGHQKIDTTMHYAMVKQQNVKLAHRKYIG